MLNPGAVAGLIVTDPSSDVLQVMRWLILSERGLLMSWKRSGENLCPERGFNVAYEFMQCAGGARAG